MLLIKKPKIMKKKTLLAGVFISSISLLSAQEVISTQGDSYDNGTNTIDFTIGEPVIETVSDGTNDATQGFHQTNLTITNIEDLDANFSVNIYPNPTSEVINLTIEKYEKITFQIFDMGGKLVEELMLTSSTTNVNVSDYPKGTYLLTLTQSDKKKIKTYKIVKK